MVATNRFSGVSALAAVATASGSGTWTKNSSTPNGQARNQTKSAAAENATIVYPLIIGKTISQFGINPTNAMVNIRCTTANPTANATLSLLYLPLSNALTNTNIVATTVATASIPITASATDQTLTLSLASLSWDNVAGAVNPGSYELVLLVPTASSTVLTIYDALFTYADESYLLV